MKPTYSTHHTLDDLRWYQFTRNSGLPRGYFDRPKVSPDGWVYVVCMVAALIAWLV